MFDWLWWLAGKALWGLAILYGIIFACMIVTLVVFALMRLVSRVRGNRR